MRIRTILFAMMLAGIGGCGGSAGEPCSVAGQTSECGGDVCTALRGGGAACEAICTTDSDCDVDSTCDQSGSDSKIKACRPKSDDDGDHHGGEGGN